MSLEVIGFNMADMKIEITVALMWEEEEIEETEEVIIEEVEVVIRIKIEQIITIIKKETPEEDINNVVAEKTIEAIEATVEIAEEDIKVIVTSTTKTKIIKMKISITKNSILILRNSNK